MASGMITTRYLKEKPPLSPTILGLLGAGDAGLEAGAAEKVAESREAVALGWAGAQAPRWLGCLALCVPGGLLSEATYGCEKLFKGFS